MKPKILFPFTENSPHQKISKVTKYTKFGYVKDGIEFLDTSLGNCGSFMLGFDRFDIIDDVHSRLRDIPFVSGEYMSTTEATIELSEKLYTQTGGFYSFYSTSGSDAIEGAIKVARLYHLSNNNNSKKIILGITESYHGSTYLSSSISAGSFMTMHLGKSNLCDKINRSDSGEVLIENIKEKFSNIGSENISCIVIESCSWLGGVTPYNRNFWIALKDFCNENDVLLIIDDIAMCGGKKGKLLGFDVMPDIFVMGKALSGGYFPLSACLLNERIYSAIQDQFWAHGFTYSFSLSGIYSTLKYLEILENENVFGNYNLIHDTAKEIFDNLVNEKIICSYTNYGLYFNLKFYPVKDITSVQNKFFENGLNVGIQNYEWKGLRVIIPLTANQLYFNQLDTKLRNALHPCA